MVAKLGGQPAKACLGQPRVVLISCRASPTCCRPNFAKSLKFSFYFHSRCSRVLKCQRFIHPSGPPPQLAIGRLFNFYGISLLALTWRVRSCCDFGRCLPTSSTRSSCSSSSWRGADCWSRSSQASAKKKRKYHNP